MPDFAGVTPIVRAEDVRATWVWVDGTQKSRIVSNPPSTVTEAEIDEMVGRMSAITNAGLLKYKVKGTWKEISLNDVTIMDESHGINSDLILFYQKQDTLDTREIRIPAPGAEYFTGGVTLKDPIATVDGGDAQENIINDLLVAINAVVNKDLIAGELWGYNGGYLSTSTPQERRKVPNASRVIEPLPGSPADGPGEDNP